ncbi:hypothetical protein CORC01_00650 [Colletotrichum orchidophilum]|uniref:BTB domain-containing protein n=1 Tax=Colletotrichum orchidophilum TaxID=1209926 RepID=A0A1G4BSD9_9PEZI|nr:uncharacterized protein CORC01_00650 [Colletotrichum orchidophilum]OHF04311.1 hypothetical protein CORC01_00650 [Colletotrichum orchidophilum]
MSRLLKSGVFSDCEVKCDGKTWKLHKSILCIRSGYFNSCLTNGWPEGKTGCVEITLFTKEQMDWIISYIYTGKFDFDRHYNNKTFLHTAVQLWTLGDYFLVRNLCDDVECRLSAFIPRSLNNAILRGFQLDAQDWLNAGRLIYTDFNVVDSKHVLKAEFLNLTLGKTWARKLNLRMPEFKTLCQSHPKFGNDCMVKLVDDGISKLQ